MGTHNNPKRITKEEARAYTLADFGFTPEAMKHNHFGVTVTNPDTGEYLPDSFYQGALEMSLAKVEKRLDIVILPRFRTEHHDYNNNNFNSYMYMRTERRPVLHVETLGMEIGANNLYNIPQKWLRVYTLPGQVQVQPTAFFGGGGVMNLSHFDSRDLFMLQGMQNSQAQTVPQSIHLEYLAGMLPPERSGVAEDWEMPADLWTLVIKSALIEVMQQWGRLIIGAGIASSRISVDGIDQSIDTTQSAMYGGASADILQLNSDIESLYGSLEAYYGLRVGII